MPDYRRAHVPGGTYFFTVNTHRRQTFLTDVRSALGDGDRTSANELARTHALRSLDRAEEMRQKALAINEKLGRQEGMASAYGNLGLIYRTCGDFDRAEEMHKEALAINDKLGRQEGMARQYGNLGVVYQTRGNLDRAEEMYKKALAINEKLGRQEGIAIQYVNLGASTRPAASSIGPRRYSTRRSRSSKWSVQRPG